ncbi:hypothetical protein ES703_45036 [subsurface metagenome]
MNHLTYIPIHLAPDFKPCVHCGSTTTWRVGSDEHPCCPDCYDIKEPWPSAEPTPGR